MNFVSIDEDDEGMRNLYPAALKDEVYAQMDEAVAASERNRSASGLGWDAMHEIQSPSKKYSDFGLKVTDCAKVLGSVFPRIAEFTVGGTPSNPFYRHETDAHCYGLGNELYIKLEISAEIVDFIWFDICTSDEQKLALLKKAIFALNEVIPSVVADYWLHADGLISDDEFMKLYFDELAKFDGEEP